MLLEDIGARYVRNPDTRFDMKPLEGREEHVVGRLLPEMRKLFVLEGREQRSRVPHIQQATRRDGRTKDYEKAE